MNSLKTKPDTSIIFFPLVTLTLIMWVFYRTLFSFPVWFDETVGKAIFFGLPVWVYVTATRDKKILESFDGFKLQYGLMLGLLFGGVFGFVGSILAVAQKGGVVEAVWLFNSELFWKEFFLAMMTAFWETLLFYGLVMTVVMNRYKDWNLFRQVLLTAVIFVVFHLPNTILRFSPELIIGQAMLLFLFSIGQAYLFASSRNSYALIMSHAIWGMVLLIHSW